MSTITYIVKVASGKFTIDDAVAPKLTFRDGDTYVFDQSDNSNSGHILQFSATSNNSGSSEYTTGVTKTGTAGSSGAKTTIVTSGSTTDTLYYYSSGGGDHGSEFSNSGFNTSTNYSFLKPIIGGANTAEKWGSMVNHAIDQIDQNISGQDLDGATDSGTVAVDLDTQSLTVAGSNGIATSGSGQTITISGEALAYQGEPHIIPNVLYPAVAGKDLSGTALGGSYTYGTAHTDGRSYYYTDIKGSKPIKDPRIGGHFGSQRHKFKSLQLLEQETATHGTNTYSIDGREWCRVVGNAIVFNGDGGNCIQSNETGSVTPAFFVEIVGYFNDFNCISRTSSSRVDDINVTVNGTTTNSADTDKLGGRATANSPLRNRYVDMGSVINHGDSTVATNLGTTPKINTIKLEAINTGSEYWQFFGIELIAQDTTSTANRSKIQIPSQNVVSYGKKFTVSGTPHYDPFNGFVNDTTLFSSVVDTATSLGLGTATTWGAPWDKGGNDHIRPFNGGRVVKWVDSSGTIKTSVTMMPANAQNIGTDASNEITTASATNSHTINFSDDAVENSLSEVAKTFHWREFGNGNANGGDSGTYKDFSMTAVSEQDRAYVMDDGLTSMSALDTGVDSSVNWYVGGSDYLYISFIGTGISFQTDGLGVAGILDGVYAQNLPYGTHIVKLQRSSPYDVWVDGVQLSSAATVSSAYIGGKFITFHQPKKPPIPEDAVVLADYMLMADYVKQADAEDTDISKGVRLVSASRDHFCDVAGGSFHATANIYTTWVGPQGYYGFISPSSTHNGIAQLPFFGTSANVRIQNSAAAHTVELDGSGTTESALDNSVNNHGDVIALNNAVAEGTGDRKVIGLHTVKTNVATEGHYFWGTQIISPVHTSFHYQTFETPYLNELVGGDRNMEQNNLIVTPDGKSWDEVTRDTSYIGNIVLATSTDTAGTSSGDLKIMDEWRGSGAHITWMNKDFAIAYDRVICLRDGQYVLRTHTISNCGNADTHGTPKINGQEQYLKAYGWGNSGTERMNASVDIPTWLKRGDYIQIYGVWYGDTDYSAFWIERIK